MGQNGKTRNIFSSPTGCYEMTIISSFHESMKINLGYYYLMVLPIIIIILLLLIIT